MKKKICAVLALLLCMALLAGCGQEPKIPALSIEPPVTEAPLVTEEPAATEEPADPAETPLPEIAPTGEREGVWDLVPFDQMPYERPELDPLKDAIEAVGEALDAGEPYEKIEELLDICDEYYGTFSTMDAIAFIRSCQDMTDEYYADEYAWCDDASAELSQLIEKLYYRCGMSDMALELEEKYFWPGFAEEYADDANAIYDDEMVSMMQEESALVAEYRALVANPTIILKDGSEMEFFTALEELQGMAYIDAVLRYYEQYNPKLARVYIDMIKIRQAQAKHLGYESYEAMAFDHGFERDYSPELAEEYLEGIKEYIVPLYRKVLASSVMDTDNGELSAERLEEVLHTGVSSMGDEVLNTYEFMVKYRLCDIAFNPRKAEMSFETYLDNYNVPFLFMDADGTLSDITTFSHEFGHYLDGFLNEDAHETIDLAECYSQAMELLMLTRLDGVLTEQELDSLYRIKMLSILDMYVQQASFAEFEHIVYSADPEELSADFLNDVCLRLTKEYGYFNYGLEDFYNKVWQDITHFYEQPFYVITYPVSHDIAMQIFQLEREEPGKGLEMYLKILPREYPDMLDTALNAGLESPFDPGRLEKVADTMREILLG